MSRQTLKAILAILVAILSAGSAGATEGIACRAGAMEFRQGGRVMKVNRTGYGSADNAERVVFRGTVSGKPYVFDVITVPGNSLGGFVSERSTQPSPGGLPMHWGKAPKGWYDGMQLDIEQGPLPGAWKAVCRK